MSEPNNTFPFPGMEDSEGLDVASIFGGGGPASDINPFDLPAVQTEQPAAPQEQPQPESAAAPVVTPAPAPAPAAAPEPAVAPEPQPVAPPAPQGKTQKLAPAAEPANPISAAIDKQETQAAQTAAKSLFEKPPIFSYGSAKDEITDGAMTFEELRIQKSDDFPELGEGKRVSWSVEYGKVTKAIADPKGTTIQSVKEEIERSKAFLDGLKKSKDKSPDCLVKPRVTAQSKGIAGYKGLFTSLEEAKASDKTICLFPSGDGKVYELRKTELGEFIAPEDNVVEFPRIRAGFTPALPLIPQSMLQQIISFFRCYMNETEEFEALAHILWDKELDQFVVHVPPQEVSKARVNADLSRDEFPETRYLHYMDIHSHNSMAAKFSPVDDQDERATRLYVVLGRLDRFFPEEFYISPKEFLGELDYLKKLACGSSKATVRFSSGKLFLMAAGGNYSTQIQIDGESTIGFGFELHYMVDALRQFRGEPRVRMKVINPSAPIVLEAEGRGDFAMVLPVRMKEAAAA